MSLKNKAISISLAILLTGCSSPSNEDFSRKEKLKERIENNSSYSFKSSSFKQRERTYSFKYDNLRLDNPELKFVYFPRRYNSAVSAPRTVRMSLYERVHFNEAY